jgi:predicted amidohydrolase YtcJ
VTDADLALIGARVHTADRTRPRSDGVAVSQGKIAAVGSADEIQALIGPRTRVFELSGGMVVPGFQDAHVHPVWAGIDWQRCDLHDLFGEPAYLDAVARYARAHPERAWIAGGGWSMDAFPAGKPTREALDAVVSDRPVYLASRDGHGAWVNSKALAAAAVEASTLDPPLGRIERQPDGMPSGCLQEAAMDLVGRLVPPPSPAEWEEGLRMAQAHLHALGITAWQDAWVTRAMFDAYRALASRDELTARVVASLEWDPGRGQDQVEELLELRRAGTLGRLRATTVKIFADGVVENGTAALIEPYLDARGRPTANRGMSMLDPRELADRVTRLDREGFQVHIHAIGDRAIRDSLSAFEAARTANGDRDARHHIAHIQVIQPEDLPRFASLDVVANGQPYWACVDGYMRDLTLPVLGPARSALQYPFRSLLDSGATLAFGSDWTVSTPDPMKEMEVAVNRVSPEHRGEPPFLPEQRISLQEALAAFTTGSAFVNHMDRETGSISVGKLADLAVLDRDLFATNAGPIGDARVVLTVVDGRIVHADPEVATPH